MTKIVYKVVNPFNDKVTEKSYQKGDIIEDVADDRLDALYLGNNPYDKQYIVIKSIDDATKSELVDIAEKHKVEVSKQDTKAEMLKALVK
ncbi:hypothetical protein [Staphylococcus hsinchuensis]|uniref:Phage protein n=1 Tax=Staphylococcus hsinchuensis TaxID=3051183 RepID=A0ABZ3EA47_9STAP